MLLAFRVVRERSTHTHTQKCCSFNWRFVLKCQTPKLYSRHRMEWRVLCVKFFFHSFFSFPSFLFPLFNNCRPFLFLSRAHELILCSFNGKWSFFYPHILLFNESGISDILNEKVKDFRRCS